MINRGSCESGNSFSLLTIYDSRFSVFSTGRAARNDTLRARMRSKYLSTLMTIKFLCSLVVSAFLLFAPLSTRAQNMTADLVILSQDIFRIDPVEIERVTVRLTIMDGRVVYEVKK